MDNINVSEIMSKVMSNPELMNSLRSTAETLFGSSAPNGDVAAENADNKENEKNPDNNEDSNIKLMDMREKKDESESKHIENEQRMQLLIALKPYMDDNRREKIDYMLKIMKLLQITEIGGLIKNLL